MLKNIMRPINSSVLLYFPQSISNVQRVNNERTKMVKSKTNKMHLEITNDVELNVEGTSTSKRNGKSIKAKSMKNPKTKAIIFSKAGRIRENNSFKVYSKEEHKVQTGGF